MRFIFLTERFYLRPVFIGASVIYNYDLVISVESLFINGTQAVPEHRRIILRRDNDADKSHRLMIDDASVV